MSSFLITDYIINFGSYTMDTLPGTAAPVMENKDWYENWFGSPWYKILYRGRDEWEAEQFVESLLDHLQPLPGSRVLDIACGEGRYARQLAGHGFDVTGIDISKESIALAKQHENERLHFFVHDKRYPLYTGYFDYAFNFFTSFGYFAREEDHQVAANSFAAALREDGLLVIDYMNVPHVLDTLVTQETVVRGEHVFDITRRLENGYIVKDIRFRDQDGNPMHFAERVAAFRLNDFLRIFRQAGLSLSGTYGDYRLNDYHPAESERLIMIFKK